MATFQEQFEARKAQSRAAAENTLGSALNEQNKTLGDLYNQNMAIQDQAFDNTRTNYNNASRLANSQLATTQRQQDRFADVRNLNRQAGSQQALSMGMGNRQVLGSLAQQQALAAEEANRQRELQRVNNQNMMKQALADHDYRKAAAILDADNESERWLMKNAALYASATGDYSGYEPLYGWDTANKMKWMNVAADPDFAYNMGLITSEQYKYRTGYDSPTAKVTAAKSRSGGYYGGGGYRAPAQQTEEQKPTANGIV